MGQFIVVPLSNYLVTGSHWGARIQHVIEEKINTGIKQVQADINQTVNDSIITERNSHLKRASFVFVLCTFVFWADLSL